MTGKAQRTPPHAIGTKTLFRTPEQIANKLVQLANGGQDDALYWLGRLAREGLSNQLLRDVETRCSGIRVNARLTLDPASKRFYYRPMFPIGSTEWMPDEETAFAFAISKVIDGGFGDRIRQCQLEDCGTFFIGDPRARWCSKGCGSLYRVRKARGK